jgi:hypothetical protein
VLASRFSTHFFKRCRSWEFKGPRDWRAGLRLEELAISGCISHDG